MDISYTLSEALKCITISEFILPIIEAKKDDIINFSFKINEPLTDRLNETSIPHHFDLKSSVIVSFESLTDQHETKIFWRQSDEEKMSTFRLTSDDDDGTIVNYCKRFIYESIKNGDKCILQHSDSRRILSILDLGYKNDLNLLMKAVIEGNDEKLICDLLKYGFDVDCEFTIDNKRFNAIDKAWENYINATDEKIKEVNNKVILSLLNANSKYPRGFDYNKASEEVQQFSDTCLDIHEYADKRDYGKLNDAINLVPHLCHIYDEDNISLMLRAMNSRNDKVTNYLSSIGVSIGGHETVYLQHIYDKYDPRQLQSQRIRNQKSANENPEIHILVLQSKSKIGANDRQHQAHWKTIHEAYSILNQNSSCKKVLKIVAAFKNVQIFFDFKHSTTYYFDPISSVSSLGITYNSGLINIGAKDLLNERKKFEVIGVIIHEFCHFAVLVTFMNNFDPFPMGESNVKNIFVNEVFVECERNQGHEMMVANVFNSYKTEDFYSELIVLVVQMMMHYYVQDPLNECENSKILKIRKQKFGKLFNFFEDFVEVEFEKALKLLKILQKDDENVEFKMLTESMKARILHQKINFQGQKTSIFEILGEKNDKILSNLGSNEIKRMLIKNQDLKVGDDCKLNTKYKYVDRDYSEADPIMSQIEILPDDPFEKKDNKNLIKIINKVESSKIFILRGKAGDGKTSNFEFLAKTLKERYKNFWVSLIKLRNFKNIFNEFFQKYTNLNVDEICELFCEVLNFRTDIEEEIFKNLFFKNQIILFLDGIDEVCPKFNEPIFNILKTLKTATKIQLWISTRPQHVYQLELLFNTKSFTLRPYSRIDRFDFQLNIYDFHKFNNLNAEGTEIFYIKHKNFNNPLLIQIVTELYINKRINLKTNFPNRFDIYDEMFEAQKDEFDGKIDRKDRDPFEDFSHKKVHQVLALKFIFEEEKIKDLDIMKKWKNYKKNWTAEKIQRFGFVIVDLDFLETDNKNSIDFIHKTVAEFFIAQYLIDSIFDFYTEKSQNEIKNVFSILKFLEREFSLKMPIFNDDDMICDFLHDKLKQPNAQKFNKQFKNLIMDEIRKIMKRRHLYIKREEYLNFWCPFLFSDAELLAKFWNEDDQKKYLKSLILSVHGFFNMNDLFKCLCNFLGDNFHATLNPEEFCINYQFKNIESNFADQKNEIFRLNFCKLLDLVDKIMPMNDQFLFVFHFFNEKYLNLMNFSENYLILVFIKICSFLSKFCHEKLYILEIFISKTFDFDNFRILLQILANSGYNRKTVQSILFTRIVIEKFQKFLVFGEIKKSFGIRRIDPIDEKLKTKISQKSFKFFVELFTKFSESPEEIQYLLSVGKNIFKIFLNFTTNFKLFAIEKLKEIFHTNPAGIFAGLDINLMSADFEKILQSEFFLVNFFNPQDSLVTSAMSEILINSLKNQNSSFLEKFVEFFNLLKKYEISGEFLSSWVLLPQLFHTFRTVNHLIFREFLYVVFKDKKSKLIENFKNNTKIEAYFHFSEFDFEIFENILNEFYDGIQQDLSDCLHALILSFCSYEVICGENRKFIFYKKNDQYLINNIYPKILPNLRNLKTFSEVRSEIILAEFNEFIFNPQIVQVFLKIYEEFIVRNYGEILLIFFDGNQNKTELFIKKHFKLSNDAAISTVFYYRINNSIIFEKYKIACKDLQNSDNNWVQLFRTFQYFSNYGFPDFLDGELNISHPDKLDRKINSAYKLFMFLLKSFNKDQLKAVKYMRKILSTDFRRNPLLVYDFYDDQKDKKFIKNLQEFFSATDKSNDSAVPLKLFKLFNELRT